MKTLDARTLVSLKNILFATDYSFAANAALPYALGIARAYGSKVYAVHVRSPQMYAMTPPEAWPELAKASEKEGQKEAGDLKKQLGTIPNEVVIGEGNTWGVISRIIKENDIDLVVIGTHGRTGLEKVLLGSVAEVIFRQAPCPVLTVGPRVPRDADRLLQMREILYPTDFTPQSLAAAPYAFSLAQENQAHLVLMSVLEQSKTGDLVHPEHYLDSTKHKLRGLVPAESESWCSAEEVVECGAPAEKILEVAARRGSDLIVLGVRHGAGPLGASGHLPWATAYRIVSHAPCPVLTVRG